GADVVMMLRIQKERLGSIGLFPNTREYARTFGLGPRTLRYAKRDAIVMHPGPMNRGVEIDPAVADGERSVILDQVTYGFAVRMATPYLPGGGSMGPISGGRASAGRLQTPATPWPSSFFSAGGA